MIYRMVPFSMILKAWITANRDLEDTLLFDVET